MAASYHLLHLQSLTASRRRRRAIPRWRSLEQQKALRSVVSVASDQRMYDILLSPNKRGGCFDVSRQPRACLFVDMRQ